MSTSNLDGFCRSCLSQKNFLCASFDTKKYRAMYSEFVPCVSGFPFGMCIQCFRHLQNAIEFRKQCVQSEKTLIDIQRSLPAVDNPKLEYLQDAVAERQLQLEDRFNMVQSSTLLVDSTEQNDHRNSCFLLRKAQTSDGHYSIYVISHTWTIKRSDKSCFNKTDKKIKTRSSKRIKNHKVDRSKHFSSDDDSTVQEYISKRLLDHKLDHSHNDSIVKDRLNVTRIKTERDEIFPGFEDTVNDDEAVDYDDGVCNSTTRRSHRSNAQHFQLKGKLRAKVNASTYDPSIATMITLCEEEVLRKMDQIRKSSQFKCSEHTCTSCAMIFTSQYLQNEHVQKFHSSDSQLQCHLCSRNFPDIKALRYHIAKHLHKYKCKTCARILSDWQAAKIHHERSHDANGEHMCDICKKYFKNKRILNLHLKMHDTNKSFACAHCPRVYAVKVQLVDHMSSHTGVKLHVCPVCSKSFARRSAMIHHSILHDERARLRYRCEECGLSYASRGKLNEHLRVGARHLRPESLRALREEQCNFGETKDNQQVPTHDQHPGITRFECEACNGRFLYASELRTHTALKHGNFESQRKFVCDACGKSFSAFRTLKIHKRRNHKIGVAADVIKEPALRRFRCRVCMKTFYSDKELATHRDGCLPSGDILKNKTLNKSKRAPRKCPLCQKLLTTSAGLKLHMFCHSGDRPFVCSECGRRFTQPGNLKRHIRVRHLTYVLGG